MKRIVTLVIALIMMLSLAVPALADSDDFVQSPSLNRQPRMIRFGSSDPNWDKELIVTAYADRHTLAENYLTNFENAYWNIVNATDLATVIPGIAEFTQMDASELGISDLFHVNEEEKEATARISAASKVTKLSDEMTYTMTIECNTMEAYKSLVHFNGETWEIVEGATEENGQITFTTSELGVYAVVVEADAAEKTGDQFPMMLLVGLMVVAAAGIVVLLATNRKKA